MRYLLGFMCVCALGVVSLVGCSDESVDGTGGNGAMGGMAGTGGADGMCTNAEDTAVFDMLEYTNDDGGTSLGVNAAANIAGDCLFGEPPGCGAELAEVILDNNAANNAALTDCVVACTSMQADLTPGCLSCYGDIVTCGAANCVRECAEGAFLPDCQTCLDDNNCNSDFAECSGGIGTACTNVADTAVYEGLDPYTNDDGTFTGTEAAGEIATDCVFGTAPNLTPGSGCADETAAVLADPTTENIAAGMACVVQCTIDNGVGLSADCLSCYGGSVTCGAVNCIVPCAGGTDLPECEACRCGDNDAMEDCVTNFGTCAGIASIVTCPP